MSIFTAADREANADAYCASDFCADCGYPVEQCDCGEDDYYDDSERDDFPMSYEYEGPYGLSGYDDY